MYALLLYATRALLTFGLVMFGQLIFVDAIARSQTVDNAWLQASGEGLPFEVGQFRDFDDYILQTRQRLKRHKLYLDPDQKEIEFAAALPFERAPIEGCLSASSDRPSKGILLLHGLSDMPVVMSDLAEAFASRCFLVRTILLPGHGTRAGDLLEVTRGDWLEATRFGLKTLKEDVDEVFVGGFSLGGLLSIHALFANATVKGAFVFSPALALESAWLVQNAVWLRYIVDWLDRDPPDDYVRYEAFPVNATAEIFLLTEELAGLLEENEISVPVFMAQSADDPVIDVTSNFNYFQRRFNHPGSRLIVYRQDPQEGVDPNDGRISYNNSLLPEQRIAGFSHLSVHIAPTNTHYGVNGDYRSCDQSSGDSTEAVARCLAAPNPWRAEVYGNNLAMIPAGEPVARLTYNPRFGELLDQIDEFITVNSF